MWSSICTSAGVARGGVELPAHAVPPVSHASRVALRESRSSVSTANRRASNWDVSVPGVASAMYRS